MSITLNLLQALKDLTAAIDLSKLNIRKDFSLLNAHAFATRAIYEAEQAQAEGRGET